MKARSPSHPGLDIIHEDADLMAVNKPPGLLTSTVPREPRPTLLAMVRAEQTLLFSSNYPSWEYGDPFEMIADLPDQIRRQVLVDNALALYGDRLLAPNT